MAGEPSSNPLWLKLQAQHAALNLLARGTRVPIPVLEAANTSCDAAAWSTALVRYGLRLCYATSAGELRDDLCGANVDVYNARVF